MLHLSQAQVGWFFRASALVVMVVGCRSGTPAAPVGAADGAHSFMCGASRDYRPFLGSAVLAGLNTHVPRREQTRAEAESLTPGRPFWQFQDKPQVGCSSDGYLELRYATPEGGSFPTEPNRMTITIAPGGRLLDPEAYARMKSLATALDEALTLLRTKSCSDQGARCDLQLNQDPLRFPGTRTQYSVDSEFKNIGRRAWVWQLARNGHQILRTTFSTSDGRFDVQVVLDTTGSQEAGTGSLELIPQLLSDEYDKGRRPDGGVAG
jgi:hypothetical protein